MAKLYFHYATMNAGKTTMLLQASYNYRERGMGTMLFVAGHYQKGDSGLISSRIGLETEAEMFRDGDDLFARVADHHEHTTVHCVFVDEAQFLDEEQVWQLARIADRLNIPVMCYGLRTDFQGKLFSGSRALLAIADDLREVRTIRCGCKATAVVRAGPGAWHAGVSSAIGRTSVCPAPPLRKAGRAAPTFHQFHLALTGRHGRRRPCAAVWDTTHKQRRAWRLDLASSVPPRCSVCLPPGPIKTAQPNSR